MRPFDAFCGWGVDVDGDGRFGDRRAVSSSRKGDAQRRQRERLSSRLHLVGEMSERRAMRWRPESTQIAERALDGGR